MDSLEYFCIGVLCTRSIPLYVECVVLYCTVLYCTVKVYNIVLSYTYKHICLLGGLYNWFLWDRRYIIAFPNLCQINLRAVKSHLNPPCRHEIIIDMRKQYVILYIAYTWHGTLVRVWVHMLCMCHSMHVPCMCHMAHTYSIAQAGDPTLTCPVQFLTTDNRWWWWKFISHKSCSPRYMIVSFLNTQWHWWKFISHAIF